MGYKELNRERERESFKLILFFSQFAFLLFCDSFVAVEVAVVAVCMCYCYDCDGIAVAAFQSLSQ